MSVRFYAVACALFVPFAWGCGDDAEPRDSGADTGNVDGGEDSGDDADAGEDAEVDAGEDAEADAGEDAEADAGEDAEVDAGEDAEADAGSDAEADAAVAARAVYANIGQRLVSIDTTTGVVTDIGETGQDYLVFAWDEDAGVMRVITDVYSPTGSGSAATPRIGTIDLCTGTITALTALVEGETAVRRAEGFARDPETGTFFLTYGTQGTGSATQYLSENLGTVDIDTGVVEYLADVESHQDDGDLLVFVGETLFLLDVASAASQGSIYEVDLVTGAHATSVATGPLLLRFAYDAENDVTYGLVGTSGFANRGFGTLDTETGTFTQIGSYLEASDFPGANFAGMVVAAASDCD